MAPNASRPQQTPPSSIPQHAKRNAFSSGSLIPSSMRKPPTASIQSQPPPTPSNLGSVSAFPITPASNPPSTPTPSHPGTSIPSFRGLRSLLPFGPGKQNQTSSTQSSSTSVPTSPVVPSSNPAPKTPFSGFGSMRRSINRDRQPDTSPGEETRRVSFSSVNNKDTSTAPIIAIDRKDSTGRQGGDIVNVPPSHSSEQAFTQPTPTFQLLRTPSPGPPLSADLSIIIEADSSGVSTYHAGGSTPTSPVNSHTHGPKPALPSYASGTASSPQSNQFLPPKPEPRTTPMQPSPAPLLTPSLLLTTPVDITFSSPTINGSSIFVKDLEDDADTSILDLSTSQLDAQVLRALQEATTDTSLGPSAKTWFSSEKAVVVDVEDNYHNTMAPSPYSDSSKTINNNNNKPPPLPGHLSVTFDNLDPDLAILLSPNTLPPSSSKTSPVPFAIKVQQPSPDSTLILGSFSPPHPDSTTAFYAQAQATQQQLPSKTTLLQFPEPPLQPPPAATSSQLPKSMATPQNQAQPLPLPFPSPLPRLRPTQLNLAPSRTVSMSNSNPNSRSQSLHKTSPVNSTSPTSPRSSQQQSPRSIHPHPQTKTPEQSPRTPRSAFSPIPRSAGLKQDFGARTKSQTSTSPANSNSGGSPSAHTQSPRSAGSVAYPQRSPPTHQIRAKRTLSVFTSPRGPFVHNLSAVAAPRTSISSVPSIESGQISQGQFARKKNHSFGLQRTSSTPTTPTVAGLSGVREGSKQRVVSGGSMTSTSSMRERPRPSLDDRDRDSFSVTSSSARTKPHSRRPSHGSVGEGERRSLDGLWGGTDETTRNSGLQPPPSLSSQHTSRPQQTSRLDPGGIRSASTSPYKPSLDSNEIRMRTLYRPSLDETRIPPRHPDTDPAPTVTHSLNLLGAFDPRKEPGSVQKSSTLRSRKRSMSVQETLHQVDPEQLQNGDRLNGRVNNMVGLELSTSTGPGPPAPRRLFAAAPFGNKDERIASENARTIGVGLGRPSSSMSAQRPTRIVTPNGTFFGRNERTKDRDGTASEIGERRELTQSQSRPNLDWLGPRTTKAFKAAGLLDDERERDRDSNRENRAREREQERGREKEGLADDLGLGPSPFNLYATLRAPHTNLHGSGSAASTSSDYNPILTFSSSSRGQSRMMTYSEIDGPEPISRRGSGSNSNSNGVTGSPTRTMSSGRSGGGGRPRDVQHIREREGGRGALRDRERGDFYPLRSASTAPTSVISGSSYGVGSTFGRREPEDDGVMAVLKEKHDLDIGALLSALSDSQQTSKTLKEENVHLRGSLMKVEAELDIALGAVSGVGGGGTVRRGIMLLEKENTELKNENEELRNLLEDLETHRETLLEEVKRYRQDATRLAESWGLQGGTLSVSSGSYLRAPAPSSGTDMRSRTNSFEDRDSAFSFRDGRGSSHHSSPVLSSAPTINKVPTHTLAYNDDGDDEDQYPPSAALIETPSSVKRRSVTSRVQYTHSRRNSASRVTHSGRNSLLGSPGTGSNRNSLVSLHPALSRNKDASPPARGAFGTREWVNNYEDEDVQEQEHDEEHDTMAPNRNRPNQYLHQNNSAPQMRRIQTQSRHHRNGSRESFKSSHSHNRNHEDDGRIQHKQVVTIAASARQRNLQNQHQHEQPLTTSAPAHDLDHPQRRFSTNSSLSIFHQPPANMTMLLHDAEANDYEEYSRASKRNSGSSWAAHSTWSRAGIPPMIKKQIEQQQAQPPSLPHGSNELWYDQGDFEQDESIASTATPVFDYDQNNRTPNPKRRSDRSSVNTGGTGSNDYSHHDQHGTTHGGAGSPTAASFLSYSITSNTTGSPGSLCLRPEHEIHLDDMEAFSLDYGDLDGEDDEGDES